MSLGSAATLVVLMRVPLIVLAPLRSMLPLDPALAALPTFAPPYGQGAGLHAREFQLSIREPPESPKLLAPNAPQLNPG